ncbi:MAG: septum formation protein Maf [Blastochloris viridis]|uniref:Nucleoside triphosphate pyrophosphatase n=1 Tax=Blastochloris viridis TaxID=1079 RepID=A0A6N4R3E5_BLAVI|nr:MAG: septum formation protein Maf [Blastochloris viridis]
MAPKLILASQSKTRKGLLEKLGVTFLSQPADVDETPLKNEAPLAYVKRIAISKAETIAATHPGCVILAADSPVILGRRILQTPQTEDEAKDMLKLQSGRRVAIPTVLVLVDSTGKLHHKTVNSWIKMKRLSASDINAYVDAGLWKHTAGGLKIELMENWIQTTHGSVSGIMGLPLYETEVLLARAGIQTNPFSKAEKAA